MVSKLKMNVNQILPRKDIMKIRHTCISLCMASGLLFNAGCSLMIDQSKGEPQSPSALESQSKSLAGVYAHLESNGSIKPHPLFVGTAGQMNGHIILGGTADVLDIRTGTTTIKGSMGKALGTVRMGETTFRFRSGSYSTGSSTEASGSGGK